MRTEERVIGGFKYKMRQVGALTGNEIVLRLARPAAAFFADAKGLTKEGTREAAALAGIERAIGALSPRDLRFVCKKLAAHCQVWIPDPPHAAKPFGLLEVFDEHFAGRYGDEIRWLRWGIELNGFFGDVLALIGRGEEGSKSASPPASTVGSGASSSVQS